MAEPSSATTERPTDETIKETLESVVIAFILAFVFRAYVVEAFVIPTGSMAPTLLGQHVSVTCDQCGYAFTYDVPDPLKFRGGTKQATSAVCPMCHYVNQMPQGTRIRSGDRILVHKFIYSFSEPRRWDVVVFKAPHDPEMNYIKRLVGLPNEQVYLHEGNVYTRPTDDSGEPLPGTDFQIARKTDRPDVQRVVWQPIYHSNYLRLDSKRVGGRDWVVPWAVEAGDWEPLGQRRAYVFRGGASPTGTAATGRLRFDFAAGGHGDLGIRYVYDQIGNPPEPEAIEDVRIALIAHPERTGSGLVLSTTGRLKEGGVRRLIATIAGDGVVTFEAEDLDGHGRAELARAEAAPLAAGENTPVEFWWCDQEASVWIDGERVLRWAYDVDGLAGLLSPNRAPPADLPEVGIEVRGGPVTLYDVQLDRDLYYSAVASRETGRGGVALRGSLRDENPAVLGPDDFWCLGDNGPRSSDGRYWGLYEGSTDGPSPWVRERLFDGRDDRGGIVPRDLLMGRAFFVYFPPPYPFYIFPLPNFGDMRFIH